MESYTIPELLGLAVTGFDAGPACPELEKVPLFPSFFIPIDQQKTVHHLRRLADRARFASGLPPNTVKLMRTMVRNNAITTLDSR
jgi:hypothetical protein